MATTSVYLMLGRLSIGTSLFLVALVSTASAAFARLTYDCETLILVDGYSSAKYLPSAFRKTRRDLQIIHIHAMGQAPAALAASFNKGDYDADFKHQGDMQKTLAQLEPFQNIVAVVTGAESGVLFGDELSEALKNRFPTIPSNGIDLARRNKFLQSQRLAQAGIDSVRQMKTVDPQQAVDWVRKHHLLKNGAATVVVKPLESAGSHGIYFCGSEDDLRRAVAEVLREPNVFGQKNHEALVQEFLEGDEYVVNTTGRDGHHLITDIWEYKKRLSADGKRRIYAVDTLRPVSGALEKTLMEYHLKALKAFQFRTGNAHGEIMMVPGRGPVLIEMNFRMMGASQPLLTSLATNQGQIDRTVHAYLRPETFKDLPSEYTIYKHPALISLANFVKDARLAPNAADKMREVSSYYSHSFSYGAGEPLPLTNSMTTSFGDIWLLNENPDLLQRDISTLLEMEKNHQFIQIAPSSSQGEVAF